MKGFTYLLMSELYLKEVFQENTLKYEGIYNIGFSWLGGQI